MRKEKMRYFIFVLVMNDKIISSIPVVDSENNLNGIITRTDIVKALLETKKELVH